MLPAIAPAWFQEWSRTQFEPFARKVDRMEQTLNTTAQLCATLHNATCDIGYGLDYKVVPFADGSDPTSDEHNLPPLWNLSSIKALNPEQLRKYHRGYYPPPQSVPRSNEALLKKVKAAVGCRAK
ncbi:hypothetical protein AMATHDRAFT_67754 [Amanita thiersii Skay4041]|uniref:Mug135-like C-terminal domain-containing protein n=1 Tax=Amanita thiersii Skay4041 TaxID=703135 RepID=A0A2A9NGN1_9AGAR|nr:hypothetical protein AMATHDRAFT_67754 [Amanita thiersii Skay4041]